MVFSGKTLFRLFAIIKWYNLRTTNYFTMIKLSNHGKGRSKMLCIKYIYNLIFAILISNTLLLSDFRTLALDTVMTLRISIRI